MTYSAFILSLLITLGLSVDSMSQTADSSNYQLAKAAYKNEAYERAIKYYQLAYSDAIEAQDISKASVNLNGAGISFKKLGQYDSAIRYYKKAAALDSIMGDEELLYSRFRNLGVAHKNIGKYEMAIEYFNKALALGNKMNSEKRVAGVKNSIGNVLYVMERNDEAIKFFKNSLEGYRKDGSDYEIATVLNNLGSAYVDEGELDSAIFLLRECLVMKQSLKNRGSISYTAHNLGRAYLLNDQLDSAKFYLDMAYDIRKELNDQAGVAYTANELATYYMKQDSLLEAARFLRESFRYSFSQQNERFLESNLKIQADAQFQAGNYKEAFQLLEQWSAKNDSTLTQVLDAASLKNEFDVEQVESLRQASETEAKNQRIINRIVIAGLGLVLLAALVLFIQQRRIKKLNSVLHTLNKDIRHRKHNDYQRLLRELEKMGFPATDTFRNMLYASVAVDEALYEAGEEMIQSQTYFALIIDELKQALNLDHRVKVRITLEDYRMSAHKATKTAYILSELLTNTVKHNATEKEPLEVSIQTKVVEKEFVAIYSDNGKPVDTAHLEESNGMGWKLMNGFTRQLGGTINFSRIAGQNIFTLAYKLDLQTRWI